MRVPSRFEYPNRPPSKKTTWLRVQRLGDLLKRIKGRIDLRRLDRVTPLAVPVLVTLGSTEIGNAAMDALLEEAAADLIEEATSGEPGQEAML
jgi:Lhr-like helicase